MNLTLIRKEARADGIFGELRAAGGDLVAVTLEHAYEIGQGFAPKLPAGIFKCVRGPHRLHGMTEDFTTFEISGVPGHSNILFHWGNFNHDSEGCVLLGMTVAGASGSEMITCSREAFARFMELQSGVDSFELVVTA